MMVAVTRSFVGMSVATAVAVMAPQQGTPEQDLIAWSVRALLGASLVLNGYFIQRTAKLVADNEKTMQRLELAMAAHLAEWGVWREVLGNEYGSPGANRRTGPADRRHHGGDGDSDPDVPRIESGRRSR